VRERGGTSSQNMIYLDAAPIYNAGHLMGIFSTFNDNALVNATLYKGQIPAQLGGATSSVFDINTKNGNFQQYKVNASIGLLSAKVSTEGPIVKDKLSFFVAGRRSYLDLFLKATDKYKDNVLNFYDINAKVNYNISDKDKLFLSFFSGQDNMGLKDMMEMKWGNNATTLRWFHEFNNNLYANTSLINAAYKATSGLEILDNDYSFDAFIKQAGVKEEIKWIAGRGHNLNMGFHSLYLSVLSAEWNINNLHEKEKRNAWENALWINDDWNLSDYLMVSGGLRLNIFSVLGGAPLYKLDDKGDILEQLEYKSGDIVKSYYSWEPRLSLNYRIKERQSIKLGYSRTSQNIHALHTGSSSMPFDRYTMTSNIVKPQLADQVSLGYITVTENDRYEFSVESYYKKTRNVLDYKDGKSLLSEIEIERLLLSGKGRAYGLEFYARKNLGRLTGWVAYTLSWSENKIDGINNDKWYTAGNDRRHDISVVGMYDLSDKWQLAATWVYNTGQALTAPSAKYELNGETYYYYAERNGYRAPTYHRLDVSATRTKKKGRYEQEWSFGIYNLYNQYNPYIIRFENDDKKPSGTKTMQYSLFGFLPSVSYTFKF
ncbi:MAG: TonB-dependent receptor, partial [Odoribacter sp.]|nr:TonB-dependent receptor [Odoribacter sp.]